MVRVAQRGGGFASLLGEDTLETIPFELFLAIQHASTVINWQENMVRKEMPPSWMWPFPDELEIWFEDIETARENPNAVDNREIVPLTQNELTKDFLAQR